MNNRSLLSLASFSIAAALTLTACSTQDTEAESTQTLEPTPVPTSTEEARAEPVASPTSFNSEGTPISFPGAQDASEIVDDVRLVGKFVIHETDDKLVAVNGDTGVQAWELSRENFNDQLVPAADGTSFYQSGVERTEGSGTTKDALQQTVMKIDAATGETIETFNITDTSENARGGVSDLDPAGKLLGTQVNQNSFRAVDTETGEVGQEFDASSVKTVNGGNVIVAEYEAEKPVVVAYDAMSGEEAWRTPLPDGAEGETITLALTTPDSERIIAVVQPDLSSADEDSEFTERYVVIETANGNVASEFTGHTRLGGGRGLDSSFYAVTNDHLVSRIKEPTGTEPSQDGVNLETGEIDWSIEPEDRYVPTSMTALGENLYASVDDHLVIVDSETGEDKATGPEGKLVDINEYGTLVTREVGDTESLHFLKSEA